MRETGVSCPDITLLPELAAVLGITVEELLNGEKSKSNMESDTVNIDKAIQYADKTAKNRMKRWQNLCAILFSAVLLLGIIVCSICDLAITRRFTWSLYSISAILYAWLVLFPMIKLAQKGIVWSLVSVSLFTIPMCILMNLVLSKILNIPIFDLWDMLDFAAVIICAIVLLVIDFKARKHPIDQNDTL